MSEPNSLGRNARVVARLVQILNSKTFDALGEVLTEDSVQEIPQSGEKVVGIPNQRSILENYPNAEGVSLETEQLLVLGEEPHYVMSPTFNLVRVHGSGDHPIALVKSRYPDGSTWWIIMIITMRGDKVANWVTYFAPAFPPPEWRAQWVELSNTESTQRPGADDAYPG